MGMSTKSSSHKHDASPNLTCSDTEESTTVAEDMNVLMLNDSNTASKPESAAMDDAEASASTANEAARDDAAQEARDRPDAPDEAANKNNSENEQAADAAQSNEKEEKADSGPGHDDDAATKPSLDAGTAAEGEADTIRDATSSTPTDPAPAPQQTELTATRETPLAASADDEALEDEDKEVSEFLDKKVSEFLDRSNNNQTQQKSPTTTAANDSVASRGLHELLPHRSPSVLSVEATKPDPPPSVVDYDEEREELDNEADLAEILNDTARPRDEIATNDENRIEGRILHAALSVNAHPPPSSRTSTVSAATEPDGLRSSALSMDIPPDVQEQNQLMDDQHVFGSNSSFPLEQETAAPVQTMAAASANYSVGEHIASPMVNRVHSSPTLNRLRSATDDGVIVHSSYMAPAGAPQPPFMSQPPPAAGMVRESSFSTTPIMVATTPTHTLNGGRRKIRLRMEEEPAADGDNQHHDENGYKPGLLKSIRRRSGLMFGSGNNNSNPEFLTPISESKRGVETPKIIDRGTITLSWFEGTSSLELQEHVRKSVARKLKLPKHVQLIDIRVLDESMDPPEEIVLSPFIPDGSEFLLRFGTRDASSDGTMSPLRPPDSPSAAPSPHPEAGRNNGLSTKQLAHLTKKLDTLRPTNGNDNGSKKAKNQQRRGMIPDSASAKGGRVKVSSPNNGGDGEGSDEDEMLLHSEDPIEARLRQITELLLMDRAKQDQQQKEVQPRHDRRQVIFTLANYFVLFLSLIAISAEIQARAPQWLATLEEEMKNVENCAANQDALFECVSRGDFAGLIASLMLWLSRSVATRRIFLFGFETPKKLWTVVYESFVTALCWGFSYMFIRRGMNPDTRHRFLQKYWKDAVYGSLAGFNAAFMKQVLKNLIPQEAVEDALRDRHVLKILSWLPNFGE